MSMMSQFPRARRSRSALVAAAAVTVAMFTAPALADRDWGQGDFYTFATDEAGWSIVEPGQTHRKIYVSADGNDSNSGLSPDSPVSLSRGVNMVREGSSDWLLLKRGDDFGDVSIRPRNRFNGESALHPIVMGAYGTGDRPVLGGSVRLWDSHSNIVLRDLNFVKGPTAADGSAIDILGNVSNLLIENVRSDGRESRMHSNGGSVIEHVTLRRNTVVDAHRNNLQDTPHADRISGWYIANASNVLIEENILDHNAWEEGYQDDPTHRDLQEPSMFSHNIYVGPGMQDMTVRDNITSRGASMGFKLVSPGVIEGNVLVANNLQAGINDGDQGDTDEGGGNYLVLRDNVSLHGADKPGSQIGARGWGITLAESDTAENAVIERNVEAHSNAVGGNRTLATENTANARRFANNVVHNWRNEPNLDPDPSTPYPDASRTIASYMGSIGEAATLDAFYGAIRDMEQGNWDEDLQAARIVRYIQEGFGVYEGGRTEPTTVTFTNAGTDGTRWDNRANWSTNDRPMAGDSVNLDGNNVLFTGNVAIDSLDLAGGTLHVRGGLLEVTGANGLNAGGGNIEIARSGQFVANGHAGAQHLGLHLEGGRFRNTGTFGGVYTLALSGGEAQLLGGDFNADVEINAGSRLVVLGDETRLGGYGSGSGELRLSAGGSLDFVFDNDGISTLGALAGSDGHLVVDADADDQAGASLGIDVGNLVLSNGLHEFYLIDVDGLAGEFGEFNISGLGENGINGLHLLWDQENGDAILTVAVNDPSINGFEYQAILVPEPSAALGLMGLTGLLATRRAGRTVSR